MAGWSPEFRWKMWRHAKIGRRGGIAGGCIAGGGIPRNLINHYFGYHIRDQRGRFTPGGSLLKKFFWNFDFFMFFCIFSLTTIVFLYKSTLGISESDFFMKLPHLWYWRNEFVLFFEWFFYFFNFWGSADFLKGEEKIQKIIEHRG